MPPASVLASQALSGGSVDIHSLTCLVTTLSLEGGANPKAVQAILGHSTLGMTMNVYAKATDRAKRDAISALHFASSKPPEHIIAVQKTHTVSTSALGSSEDQTYIALKST